MSIASCLVMLPGSGPLQAAKGASRTTNGPAPLARRTPVTVDPVPIDDVVAFLGLDAVVEADPVPDPPPGDAVPDTSPIGAVPGDRAVPGVAEVRRACVRVESVRAQLHRHRRVEHPVADGDVRL